MQTLTITGFYATLLAFLIIWLGIRVILLRNKLKIGITDGGNLELAQAMRVHGNAIEWVPMALILVACAESQHLSNYWLHGLGITLIISRSIHAFGLMHSKGRSLGRMYGTLGTWVVLSVAGIYNGYAFFML
jgi:uncharacterized protein